MDFNPYDVTTKDLVLEDPPAFLERFGIAPTGVVEEIDSGITTLSAAADKVFRVGGQEPFLVHFEFQSCHETDLVRTLWFRHVALDHRNNLPVLTLLLLLRKEANSPSLTGVYERHLPDGERTNWYNYRVLRLWQEDPEPYLTTSVAPIPLAPLTAVSEPDLPGLILRMKERIDREPQPRATMLWTSTFLLMGLRFSAALAMKLLEGVQSMKESTTYQRILREGREEGREEGRQEGRQEGLQEGLNVGEIREARRFLIVLGTERLGEPGAAPRAALEAIRSVERLEALGRRLIADPTIGAWEDLLR